MQVKSIPVLAIVDFVQSLDFELSDHHLRAQDAAGSLASVWGLEELRCPTLSVTIDLGETQELHNSLELRAALHLKARPIYCVKGQESSPVIG